MTYGPGEKGEEGKLYGKSKMETYLTICKLDRQQEFAVWLRKLKQGLCINLEGMGQKMVRRFKREGYMYTYKGHHIPCRPPKTDGSWWRVLTECGPLNVGKANHSSILAWRIPWTV